METVLCVIIHMHSSNTAAHGALHLIQSNPVFFLNGQSITFALENNRYIYKESIKKIMTNMLVPSDAV